jgi:hypothetical protein
MVIPLLVYSSPQAGIPVFGFHPAENVHPIAPNFK